MQHYKLLRLSPRSFLAIADRGTQECRRDALVFCPYVLFFTRTKREALRIIP
ncbi:hypothetical protein [Helicobacter rodentium]|uniref:hypothetical protein n=1 Tax=Helicobacter rodentium TaxID=59617 RepID=UPI0026066CB8|nr:hypothetical protein [Helicobacter rodentium]